MEWQKQSSGAWVTYQWNGHSFNPSSYDSGISIADWSDYQYHTAYPSGATSDFDLTGFQTGNEVCLGAFSFESTGGTRSLGTYGHKNPAGTIIYYWSYDRTDPNDGSSWEFWYFGAIGIRDSGAEEIKSNDTYSFYITGTFVGSVPYYTSNLDTTPVTTAISGNYMWVEGEYIHYVNAHSREQYIRHDGTDYGNVGSDQGSIWIVAGENKITYIDENGHKRKTKQGSRYRNWNNDTTYLGSAGAGNKGYIWACSYDDHFLQMVDSSGQIWRIGAGCCGALAAVDSQ